MASLAPMSDLGTPCGITPDTPPGAPAPTSSRAAWEEVAAEREALALDEAELMRLSGRERRAEDALDAAARAADAARGRWAEERADVLALESFSATRILTALRGSRAGDLERERAELEAADFAAARAEAEVADARRELDAVRAARARLGDLRARREVLHRRIEEVLGAAHRPGSGLATVADELGRLAERAGVLTTRERELAEARDAARRALAVLAEAAELLGSARAWSTYDTFFDGGLITDMVKYDRIERAQDLMRRADHALRILARELADVGEAAVGGVEITEGNRIFDVWFDNIVTDWRVRNRIGEAADRVLGARQAVTALCQRLDARLAETAGDLSGAAEQRRDLLDQAVGRALGD